MSESTSQSTGTAPESPNTVAAPAGEGLPVTQADILAAESSSDEVLAGAVAEGTTASPEAAATAVAGGDRLELSDVLPGTDPTDPNLGAYLKVETVNGNTVISVDPDGVGGAPAITVVTLEGVSGVTLQQLLQHDHSMT